jgi:hypothetical protein
MFPRTHFARRAVPEVLLRRGIGVIATTVVTAAAVAIPLAVIPLGAGPSGAATGRPALTSTTSISFRGVSAVPKTKDFVAVGGSSTSSGTSNVVSLWNGSAWKAMKAPPSSGFGGLTAVWAASSTDIWALGSNTNGAVLDRWNGTGWKEKTSGIPTGASLTGISGTSPSDIFVVGTVYTTSGPYKPVEMHFNGTSWTTTEQGPANSSLYSVAASSASNAWAVGYGPKGGVILHWTGSAWKTASVILPGGSYLNAVSVKGTLSIITGSVTTSTSSSLISLVLKGTKWTKLTMPSPGRYPSPSSVLAVSSTTAWAGGIADNSTGSNFGAFIEKFSGGKWTTVKIPSAGNGSNITSFASKATDNVWAVGGVFTGKICQSNMVPISYHYVTSWHLISVPSSADYRGSGLSGTVQPRC